MKIETLAVLAARRTERQPGAEGEGVSRPAPGIGSGELLRLEVALAGLEGGAEAAAFSSGLAATCAVLQTLSPGDRVVASKQVHGGTRRVMHDLMSQWGVEVVFVDTTRPDEVSVALADGASLVWVETPSGLTIEVSDISRIAATAHRVGAICVVDNTTTTPVLQRPLQHRADAVLHLTTSYLSGLGDSRGAAVVVAENGPFFDRLRQLQAVAGAHLSPYDSWQLCQALPSLPLRMRSMCDSALKIVSYLWGHSAVEEVHYPGLAEHPGHEVARSQMKGFGGRISFTVKGGGEMASLVAMSTRLITNTAAAGSSGTRIEHLGGLDIPGDDPPEGMLRLSVGLEHPDDLVGDLDQALPQL